MAPLHIATFNWQALEDVARLAVAELRPVVSPKEQGRSRRPGKVRTDLVAGTGTDQVAIEMKLAGGAARITERDLSRAIKAAFQQIVGQGDVVVLRGGGLGTDPMVRKLVERLPSMIEARRRALTDKHIEALVDAYLPADALASVMPDIEADNARAQAEFLKTYPTLTADEVAERAGHAAANRSATANRWKGERKIFAVRAGGREVYPAFQFEDGRPKPALQSALKALDGRSGWQTAFWFITPNGWLGGPAPIERLEDGKALSEAASREVEACVG